LRGIRPIQSDDGHAVQPLQDDVIGRAGLRRTPFDQVTLRQGYKAFREFAKPHVIARVDDDSNARVQLFISIDIDVSARPLAEYALDFESDFFLDGKVPQSRLEDLADRRDRQSVQDDDAPGLRRRLRDVAVQMNFQAAQIDVLSWRGHHEEN
jgi:hypothetical protein